MLSPLGDQPKDPIVTAAPFLPALFSNTELDNLPSSASHKIAPAPYVAVLFTNVHSSISTAAPTIETAPPYPVTLALANVMPESFTLPAVISKILPSFAASITAFSPTISKSEAIVKLLSS